MDLILNLIEVIRRAIMLFSQLIEILIAKSMVKTLTSTLYCCSIIRCQIEIKLIKNEISIVLNDPIHTTRQGLSNVLLDENDYYFKLAEVCKYILVGKFTNTMPKIELVRKSFTLKTQLKGSVKTTHFNSRHVISTLIMRLMTTLIGQNIG